jgi:hypothetical protein
MGDIVIGDKNVLGNNSRMIKIEMKNFFGCNLKEGEGGSDDSRMAEAEEAEFEEVKTVESPTQSGEKSEQLNLFAPCKNLQDLLLKDWFDKVSTNKVLYSKEWRTKLVADLMASEHGEYIARLWENQRKRNKIKGQFIGALKEAGVVKGADTLIARAVLGFADYSRDMEEKKEVNTLGKSIGEGKKEPYADWIKEYVGKTQRKR